MNGSRYHLHATLLPDGDEPIDLWVVGGRITFRPQDGAETIGVAGAFALAGLVDCHAHLTIDWGRKGLPPGSHELVAANRRDHLAAGTLLLRDIGALSDATLGLSRNDGLPPVHPAGRFLAPAGGYGGTQQPAAPAALAAVAAAQVAGGARWVKVIADWPRVASGGAIPELGRGEPNYPADALRAAVEAAHGAGGRVAVHAMTRAGIALGVDAGVDCIEHGTELDEELLQRMAAQGIAWTPTLASQQATLRSAERRGQERVARWLRGCFEQLRELLPRARALGVTVLAGTDVLPPGSVAKEVMALQRSGLQPREALAAASTAARAYLGEPGLEEGAPADLVLYPADPRESPELLERPSLIMLGGRLVAGSVA